MLYSILSLVSLAAVAYGQTNPQPAKHNDVDANYVIYTFSGSTYFPYALNKCQASSLIDSKGYLFKCSEDGETIIFETHADRTCTSGDDEKIVKYINSTYMGYDTSLEENRGKLGAFECFGQDSYVGVTFTAGDQCASIDTAGATIYAALSVCVDLSATGAPSVLNVYCSGTDAEMQYFLAAVDPTCSSATTFNTNVAGEECDYIFKFGTTDIYGQVEECVGSTNATETTTTTTSSTSTSSTTSTTEEPKSESNSLFISFSFVFIFIFFFLF